MYKTISFAIVVLALMLTGCSSSAPTESSAAVKQYPMHGKVISVDPAGKSAKIDAGPIGDWMGAMTMSYAVKNDADLAKLTPGTTFDATVYVKGDDFWVGDVKPVQ